MSTQTNAENAVSGSKPKKIRPKTSWIWQYFKEETTEQDGKVITVIKCQEMNNDVPCNVTYQNTGNSTGNAINHLRTFHNLSKDGKIETNVNRVSLF
jgi:hypothetical protein